MPLRDIALTLLISLLILSVFKYPVIGAYLWAWLSLMNPHKLSYGFAFNMPFAYIVAVVTLLMLVITRQRQPLPLSLVVKVHIALVLWMTFTSLFALAPAEDVFSRWVFVMKTQLMLWVTWMLVTEAKHLRVLIWVVTLSVAFYGIKGGVWTVLTGGGGRVWGPPGGMLQGNNELAVALVMLMPMLFYLRQTATNRWLRLALFFSMVAVSFSILGSQSRGALVALLAMAFFLGIKSKYPVRSSLALLVLVTAAISFMPETWIERMDTIRTYEADGSAMSRIWTWQTLWNAAVDRPFVGAGFVADNPVVFVRYAPTGPEWDAFQDKSFVAHSIYFQMLGEQGFVGLALFLGLGLVAWISAGRIARQSKADPEYGEWMPQLMRMVQVSLIGYAAGGAFLSLAYLDLPYYIVGFVVTAGALLQRRLRQQIQPSAEPLPQANSRQDASPPLAGTGSAAGGRLQ